MELVLVRGSRECRQKEVKERFVLAATLAPKRGSSSGSASKAPLINIIILIKEHTVWLLQGTKTLRERWY